MAFFASGYDDIRQRPDPIDFVGANPYMTDVQATPHGIMAAQGGGYGDVGPSETSSLISGVGGAATGVINAYGQKQKLDAQAAYQDKILGLLGGAQGAPAGGAPAMPTPQVSQAGPRTEIASSESFVNHPGFTPPTAATTPTTPTGASAVKIGGAPMTPTPAAPGTRTMWGMTYPPQRLSEWDASGAQTFKSNPDASFPSQIGPAIPSPATSPSMAPMSTVPATPTVAPAAPSAAPAGGMGGMGGLGGIGGLLGGVLGGAQGGSLTGASPEEANKNRMLSLVLGGLLGGGAGTPGTAIGPLSAAPGIVQHTGLG